MNKTELNPKAEINKSRQVKRDTVDFIKNSLNDEEIKSYQSAGEMSEESDTLLKDVTPSWLFETKVTKQKEYLIWKKSIKIIEGENLAQFLKRNSYTKNKKDPKLSNVSNRLKYWDEKRRTNWLRNFFCCFNNIEAISILNWNARNFIMEFLEDPTVKGAQNIIDHLELARSLFNKERIHEDVSQVMELINSKIKDQKRHILTQTDAFEYLIKPFTYIKTYISHRVNNKERLLTIKDFGIEWETLDKNFIECNSRSNWNRQLEIKSNRKIFNKRNRKFLFK